LALDESATLEQYRELGLFVRFCIAQIERDIGTADWWKVTITRGRVSYRCAVILYKDGALVQATGNGFDGAVAGREALCKVDGILRERRMLALLAPEVMLGAR
jgi:hypothetical protein